MLARYTLAVLMSAALVAPARAEVSEINVAQQYGVSFLPLMVMERDKLVEKHAKAEGLGGVKVNWVKVAGPSAPSWRHGNRHVPGRGPRDTYG